ncbi:hypothetical protein [Marinobacterium sp. BA1]|uniref:hypothetical protein n=1 Tax=Marinobacterium sp. BA1 TaxID=3138931 RepID=UPI0032E6DE1A
MQVQVKTSCKIVYDTSLVDDYTGDYKVAEKLIHNQLDGEVRWRIHEGFLTGGMVDVEVDRHDFAVHVNRDADNSVVHSDVLLNVTYDLLNHQAEEFDFAKQLEYIFQHMAGEGAMSGDTDLMVESWKFAPHGNEVSIIKMERTTQPPVSADESDPLYVIGIGTAMRNVVDLKSYQAAKGLDTSDQMSHQDAFNLYQRVVEHCNADDDGFDIEGLHAFEKYREVDGMESSPNEVLMEINNQAVGIQKAIKTALKLAHTGLVDAAIEADLDSDANTWDMREMMCRGYAQEVGSLNDPLAPSNGSASPELQ